MSNQEEIRKYVKQLKKEGRLDEVDLMQRTIVHLNELQTSRNNAQMLYKDILMKMVELAVQLETY